MKRVLFFVYLCTVTMPSFSAEASNDVTCTCGKVYKNQSTLNHHKRAFKTGYCHSCPTCGMRAKQIASLHPNGDHCNEKLVFDDKIRSSINYFCFYCINSIRIHDRKRLFATTTDQLTFDSPEDLEQHVLIAHFKVRDGTIMPKNASINAWNQHKEEFEIEFEFIDNPPLIDLDDLKI